MKNHMKKILLVMLIALASFAGARAQTALTPSFSNFPWSYNWVAATTTGVVGPYLPLVNPQVQGPPLSYTIDVYITGTLPSACTFEVQSSPDGIVWNTGAASISGDQTCLSATTTTYSFFSKPVRYLRINLGTLTGGDGTTKVYFFYTRGRTA
jgi:hypothetical protein